MKIMRKTQRCGFSTDLDEATAKNLNYRKVLYTTPHMQLVLMRLVPGQQIGLEVHNEHSQFVKAEAGSGWARVGKFLDELSPGESVIVPPGVKHNFWASNDQPLSLYVLYAPPMHPIDTIQKERPENEN